MSSRLLAGLTLAGLIACAGFAADPPAKAPPARVDLHRLDNKELLAQASALLQKASAVYLAQWRELTTLERALDRASKRSDEVKVPAPPANGTDNKPSPLEVARKSAEQYRARRDALKRLHEGLLAQKKLLDDVGRSVEATRSAALGLLGTLDELETHQLEIELRVRDRTLDRDAVPAALGSEQTLRRRKQIQTQQTELTESTDVARAALDRLSKRLRQTESDVLDAESAVTQASARADREQKRQQKEKDFESRPPADLLTELTGLLEEESGLKGTFQLSLDQVEQQQSEWGRLREVLAAMKPATAKLPGVVRPEEVVAAVKTAAALLAAQEKRIKAIGEIRDASGELTRRAREFEADAAVLGEHFFEMQVLARVLRQKAKMDLPPAADSERLTKSAAAVAKAVAGVQAELQKARQEDAQHLKELAALLTARDETQTRLAALKQAEEATLAAVEHETRLSKMNARETITAFARTADELKDALSKLDPEREAYRKALGSVGELQAKREGLKDPFVRDAEEAVRPQRARILAELRKEAGLNETNGKAAEAPPVPAKKDDPAKAADTPGHGVLLPPTEIEKVVVPLRAFQQRIGSRDRVVEEREQLKKDLLAALAEMDKQAESYAKGLNLARQLARQQFATAVNLKKRVGREELAGKDLPAGINEALQPAALKRLDEDAADLLAARSQATAQTTALNQTDLMLAQADGLRKEILEAVGQRLDLLGELQKLETTYALDRKDRAPIEAKRQQQRAAERQDDETSLLDNVLKIDASRAATSLQELLDGYYLELIELGDKDELVDQEKSVGKRLLALASKESDAVKKLLPLLDKLTTAQQAAYEEETLLARARLRPDLADDLLKKHQARTGKTLPRPVPFTEKEKAEKIDELATRVLDRLAQVEAGKRYAALLQERLAAPGLKAETGTYQDELARLEATSDANRRRVAALTGKGAEDGGTGEMGRTRRELSRLRRENALWIVGKVVLILLVAWLLPRFILWLLARLFGRGDRASDSVGLLISSLRAFVRAIVWLVALALILRVLGFDITAILAGLGIGGLAIGLAAKDMIADIISALVIFLERRFEIGDVLRIGQEKEPAKVIGLNWRMTQLRGPDGLVYNVPNRTVTNRRIQNLTRNGKTHDELDVIVTTAEDVQPVLQAIRAVIDANPDLGPASERGYCVEKVEHKEGREWRDRPSSRFKVVSYRFWWQLRNFDDRNRIRDEVMTQISERLSSEDVREAQVVLR